MKLSEADGRHSIARWKPYDTSIARFGLPLERQAIFSRGYSPLPLVECTCARMLGISTKSGLMPVSIIEKSQNRRIILSAQDSSMFAIEMTPLGIFIFDMNSKSPSQGENYFIISLNSLSAKRIKQISDCSSEKNSEYRAFCASADKVDRTISIVTGFSNLVPFEKPSSPAHKGKNLFVILTNNKYFVEHLELLIQAGHTVVIHHPREILFNLGFSTEHLKNEIHYDYPFMLKSSFEINGYAVSILSVFSSFGSNVYPYETSVFVDDGKGTKHFLRGFCEKLATKEETQSKHWNFFEKVRAGESKFLAALKRVIADI